MKKTSHWWADLRAKKLPPEQLAAIERDVEQELIPLDLRAVHELLGKTQVEVAEATTITQSEVSRLEHPKRYATVVPSVAFRCGILCCS